MPRIHHIKDGPADHYLIEAEGIIVSSYEGGGLYVFGSSIGFDPVVNSERSIEVNELTYRELVHLAKESGAKDSAMKKLRELIKSL